MKELICPNCQKAFKVDEADYAAILMQVKDREFKADRDRRIAALASKVRSHLAIAGLPTADEKFLYTIVRDYQHYALEIV